MEGEKYGTISFHYANLQEGQLRFGFKRCIAEGDKVYLIGEEIEGYGKEVLIRN